MSREALKELLMDEGSILKEAVSKAKPLIGLEQKTGAVITKVPRGELGARETIGLHLIGQYFSKELGLAESASLSTSELSERCALDPATATARLHELVGSDWVRRVSKGEFEINRYLLNPFLDEIIASRGKLTPPVATNGSEPHLKTPAKHTGPAGKGGKLTAAIVDLLGSEWGKTPRDWKEIKEELARNAQHFSSGSITGMLTLMTQSHKLRRIKEGRSYKYVLA